MKVKGRLQQEQGFTLIELMAVLAILTMLVLIAVPAIGSITKKAEAQADDATISMIEKAGGLALLGDVAYDDPEEEQYDVSTLVEEGYLDIDDGHKYAGSGNTVTHIKGYEFEFEADSEPTPAEFFTWSTYGDGVQITGYTGDAVDVVIPADIEGKPVVFIGSRAFKGSSLETVMVPASVKAIGKEAFANTPLTNVKLSYGLTSIGYGVFKESALETVTIPDSVEIIDEWAFAHTRLSSIDLGSGLSDIKSRAFYNTPLKTVTVPVPKSDIYINPWAFDDNVTFIYK